MITHQTFPSDVSDTLRWMVRGGAPWRYLPKDFLLWEMVYQQTRRWLAAGCFEAIVHDLRAVFRFAEDRHLEPTAAIFDSRTIRSTLKGRL